VLDLIGLGLTLFVAALVLVLPRIRRRSTPRLRAIAGLTRFYRAFGASVEDGTRVLISVGSPGTLTPNVAASLAGLGLVREVSQKASVSDRPPVAVAGEGALGLLAQDSLQAGYRAIGAAEYYQAVTGRVAGLTPFSSAAGTMGIIADEHVSAAALVGHFGLEAALLAEAADRSNAMLVAASSDPVAQAVLFATASEALIGEELFAASAYFAGRASAVAGLTAQDVLRWLVVLGLCVAAVLRILGVF